MKKINIRRAYYIIRHKYLTLNNIVIVIAFMIASGWIWGSLDVMQRNYRLQKELDDKSKQLIIAQLNTANAKLEQRYYKTAEYQSLAVRQRLGLGSPGESVLILPPNSEKAKQFDLNSKFKGADSKATKISNFEQWMNFLFGGNSSSLSK